MHPYKTNPRPFIIAAVLIALFVSWLSILLSEKTIDGLLISPALIITIVGFSWWIFDKHLWKTQLANTLGLSKIPDLNGYWKGTINRDGEKSPHEMTLKITQTYSRVSMTTKTAQSNGDSIKSFFMCDENHSSFQLINYWRCKTSKRDDTGKEEFHGCSQIRISDDNGLLILEDTYFTDRTPPTKGIGEFRKQR